MLLLAAMAFTYEKDLGESDSKLARPASTTAVFKNTLTMCMLRIFIPLLTRYDKYDTNLFFPQKSMALNPPTNIALNDWEGRTYLCPRDGKLSIMQ